MPLGGFDIDSRIDAAAPRAPTVSKADSHPQAILKFRPPSSLDYKARHGPQTKPPNFFQLFMFPGTSAQKKTLV